MLSRALDAAANTEERRRAASLALRRARLSLPSAGEWKRMADAFSSHGLDANEALQRWRQQARAEKDRERSSTSHRNTGRRRRETSAANAERAFEDLAPSSPQNLAAAMARFRSGAEYFDRGEFYRAAVAHVAPGREAAFIAAVDHDETLDLYFVRELIGRIPSEWSGSLSARTALAALLRRVSRRECGSMVVDRYYQPLPWRWVEELTGLTMRDLAAEAVRAIGETSIPDGCSALFRIASMLSTMLDAPQAAEALGYGVGLLEPAMQSAMRRVKRLDDRDLAITYPCRFRRGNGRRSQQRLRDGGQRQQHARRHQHEQRRHALQAGQLVDVAQSARRRA